MTPRQVRKDLLGDPDFRAGLDRTARSEGITRQEATKRAEGCVKEIAARDSRLAGRLAAAAARAVWRRAFENIRYDRERLEELMALGTDSPIVFLPSHRSNLDRPAMQTILAENGHPPNYTAGGINMNFFPLGALLRRSRVFFIRRTIKGDAVYRLVLKSYLGHLVERHHPLEWYIEATRSRTGKLLSPRYGLLSYTADALGKGKAADVYLIPVSIAYDHVVEIHQYATEQRGVPKQAESFRWLVRAVRSPGRKRGDIYVRFGEPVSMRRYIDGSRTGDRRKEDLRRVAGAVCGRIGAATPLTPASLVVAALLPSGDVPLSQRRLRARVEELVDDAESRSLPTSTPLSALRRTGAIQEVAADLLEFGAIDIDIAEPLSDPPALTYSIDAGRRLAASHYRNTIVQHYIIDAVAELALAATLADRTVEPSPRAFRQHATAIRELLDNEFFFQDLAPFLEEVTGAMLRRVHDWEVRLATGDGPAVLQALRPHRAPWVVQHLLEAHLTVAEELARRAVTQPWDRASFLRSALDRALQYVAEGRIGADAASITLFGNAVRSASDRGLLEAGSPGLATGRESFASDLRRTLHLLRNLDADVP